MATHNQARMLGFLTQDPIVGNLGEEGAEKIFFQIRTTRRAIDGYKGPEFEDIIIFYDGTDLMSKLKDLKKYDLVDIKGVVNVLITPKKSICPNCKQEHIKFNGTSTFIYPISCIKLDSLATSRESNADIPEQILKKHYEEVSNQVLLIGKVASEPEIIDTGRGQACRYMLSVDRKYYINTQDEITADFPWIYTFDEQAEWDGKYLQKGSVILVDGIMHNGRIDSRVECENCGTKYTFKDLKSEFIPYSIEYLSDFKTDEDIELEHLVENL